MKTVRMADIAEKLGISIVSVSKGLSGKDGVSDEMRAKILATAKEMGYESPNRLPKETPQSKNIGILVADRFFSGNNFYFRLYCSMLKQCAVQGDSALLEIVTPQAEQNRTMPVFLNNQKVDALVFMGEIDRNYLHAVVRCGLPYILLDFTDYEIGADCVLSDNVNGGYQITKHLISSGCHNIAYVGSVLKTDSIMDRYLGVIKAMTEAGLTIRSEWRIEDRNEDGKFIPIRLPDEMPDAFVCSCDEVATKMLSALQERGYKVPDDVAVTGYDDYLSAEQPTPSITSYRVNLEAMALGATKLLYKKLNEEKPHKDGPITLVIPGTLVPRSST